MKKIIIIGISILFGASNVFAARQSEVTVSGQVIDKTNGEPVGWATVALMTADSTVIAGTACDDKGTYEIKAAAGQYTLSVSLIGYLDYSETISLTSGTVGHSPIALEPDTQMLAGATLTERVKLVEMKIDKLVMNVSQSAFANGSNALDLIKKAPGVTIDKDGNVKLNGKSVSVWIDGRPSYMDGKSLEALLRSTNGESIDKFELMEHPSSKYDAAGQGGIINIKTKKNLKQGFSGSMGLGGGGMHFKEIDNTPWQESYWLNLGYRTDKTNSFFSIYEGFYNTPVRIVNDLSIESLNFHQLSESVLMNFYHNYNIKLGNDWFINNKNTLGVIAYVPGSYSTFNSKESFTRQYIGDAMTQSTTAALQNGPSKSIQYNLNLNYTHVFDEARSAEITGNLDYYHNSSKDINTQNDTTFLASAASTPIISRKTMVSTQLYDIYSAKADYQTVAWKRFMLESGAKWALSHTDNNSLESQTGIPDNNIYYTYNEHVGAAYMSLAGQLGQKASFKVGLRGEYTNSFGDWKSSGEKTNLSYFDLFPTAFFGYNVNEKVRLSASYTRRIDRPRYEQLNPTKMYVDSKTYVKGNPGILPQYSNDLSFSIGLGQHLSWALTLNHASQIVNQIPSYGEDGVQYLTWGNIGSQNAAFMSFNVAALPIGKWLQWTLSANGLYLNTTSDISGIVRDSFCAQAYTDLTFILPKDWKIDLDAYASSPLTMGCYRMHSRWSSNIAVKKTLCDNKLTLTAKLDDIFRSNDNNIDVTDETGTGGFTTLQQIYYSQKLIFDITWSFGNAQKPMKQRKVGNLEEMGRVGGKNN